MEEKAKWMDMNRNGDRAGNGKLDRETLIAGFVDALPQILRRLSLSCQDIGEVTGIDAGHLAAIIEGKEGMRWSEYLSVLFVLWSNDRCRVVLEDLGLFPAELHRAFSVDRKRHGQSGQHH